MPIQLLAQDSLYVNDKDYPFIIVSPDHVNKAPVMSDDEFYDISTNITFTVGKTTVREDDPFFDIYKKAILPNINGKHLQLRRVIVRGAASPEGSYSLNQRLARGRSETLINELLRDMPFQYMKVDRQVSNVTEDYGYLCLLMQRAGDKDYGVVKGIFDNAAGNEQKCKQQLMAAQGGKLWKRLLQEYFPQLRTARLVLWFSKPDAEHAPVEPLLKERAEAWPIEYPMLIEAGQIEHGWNLAPVTEPVEQPRRHMIAVRTNLLHDFFVMPGIGFVPSPNIQLEYYPLDGHYTYNIGMTWGTHRHWDKQEFFQVRDFQAEVRRYFRGGGEFMGAYLGAYIHGDKYGIGLSPTKGWEGEGGGAGLSLGYVTKLNRKGNLRLEAMIAMGFYMSLHDPYVYGNPITGTLDGDYYYDYLGSASDFKKRNHRFTWFGPTNIGLQLTYDIIYRKKK